MTDTPDDSAGDPGVLGGALNPPTQPAGGAAQVTLGAATGETPGNIAEHMWKVWRYELADLGGPSPLLHFADAPRTRIDLTSAHPSGLPRFIAGESTLLSSLVRDELALRSARYAASAITDKGVELRSVRGIDAVHLAIGLATWRLGGDEFTAPVLLRPVAIRRYGRDFELKLRGHVFFNPELERALAEQFGIRLDADEIVRIAVEGGVFKPQPVIDRLRQVTAHLPWFSVQPRLVISSFADVSRRMLADADDLGHPVIDALAGNASARQRLESAYRPAPVVGHDARPPEVDTLLLDADEQQDAVVTQISAGNSLVVTTLPGTGGRQTVVNAIGALVAQHKRVLVASPRRSSLDGIAQRLAQLGLPGVAVRAESLRRDLIHAIGRNEKAQPIDVAEVDDALVRLRRVLADYRGALLHKHVTLRVSTLEALEGVARLGLADPAPTTSARLSVETLERLADGREVAAAQLVKAARLGEFRYGPADSPWYGADFVTTAEGDAAHALARKLHEAELPRLLERARSLVGSTRLRQFENIAELGIYLKLLGDLRETLDKFQVAVFDRPLTDLIAATAGRHDSPQLSGANRRRLRKLALEYVRPGVHIADLHAALLRIQQQRTLWNRFAEAGAPPAVPVGIADVQVAYQQVVADLAALDEPLKRTGTQASLIMLPIGQLTHQISGLAAESEVLANLQERVATISSLRDAGLDPLLADLSNRHVPEEQVAAELELAWWQSTLEYLLTNEKALLGGQTGVLDRLEADFRLVDEAHASAGARLLAWQLAQGWSVGVIDHPDESEALKRILRVDPVRPAALAAAAPRLSRDLAPVWLTSPYEVADLPDALDFDVAIIVDGGACTVAENLGVIRRAKQLVVVGDPVTQTPSPFEIAVHEGDSPMTERGDVEALHRKSTLAELSELLPVFSLTRSYRAGGDDLAEMVNRRFYEGRIEALPWAGTYLGQSSLTVHHLADGSGLPDPESGAVESVDAEVARVVDLVVDHAQTRSKESLMVVTASARHAVRVQQAILRVFASRGELSDFLLGDKPEPFTVVTLEQSVALSRDRVIFSIGYGRTPHGRLLSNFGPLATPAGERLLAVGLTRARRGLDIVSCFTPLDIDDSRMPSGVVALADVLALAGGIGDSFPDSPDGVEPLLIDLAERLRGRGLDVRVGYRGMLPLVASAGGKAVVVETDHVVGAASLRESLRLRPEVLRRLGWHYLRVHSFELFADPGAVAARIGRLIGAQGFDVEVESDAAQTQPIDRQA